MNRQFFYEKPKLTKRTKIKGYFGQMLYTKNQSEHNINLKDVRWVITN